MSMREHIFERAIELLGKRVANAIEDAFGKKKSDQLEFLDRVAIANASHDDPYGLGAKLWEKRSAYVKQNLDVLMPRPPRRFTAGTMISDDPFIDPFEEE